MAALLASCSAREEQKPAFEAARVALARGDGLTAENRLNALLEEGHGAPELAAYLGEAALQQDDLAKARRWLGDRRDAHARATATQILFGGAGAPLRRGRGGLAAARGVAGRAARAAESACEKAFRRCTWRNAGTALNRQARLENSTFKLTASRSARLR